MAKSSLNFVRTGKNLCFGQINSHLNYEKPENDLFWLKNSSFTQKRTNFELALTLPKMRISTFDAIFPPCNKRDLGNDKILKSYLNRMRRKTKWAKVSPISRWIGR
jgi:hypothetical protein